MPILTKLPRRSPCSSSCAIHAQSLTSVLRPGPPCCRPSIRGPPLAQRGGTIRSAGVRDAGPRARRAARGRPGGLTLNAFPARCDERASRSQFRQQISDTVMPANLMPEYRAAEAAFRRGGHQRYAVDGAALAGGNTCWTEARCQ